MHNVSKKKKSRTKLKRSKSSTNLQSRLSHLSEISMATDIFPLAIYGVQGNLQLRDETRARAIPLFFAFSLLVPSVLLPTRYPSLVLVFFFFFWLSFLRPSRQQTTWRAPSCTLCPREVRRFSKLLNVSLFSSFTLISAKEEDGRAVVCLAQRNNFVRRT